MVEDVETASPKLWHVHVDHLHRPIRMTDAAKASVWQAEWLPWGQPHSITGTGAFSYRLPGQWFQLEAGLHYNWHRHYDPSIGRYTQPDPLGFVDGPSVYGYARGSPGRFVDKDGRIAQVIAVRCLFNPQACATAGAAIGITVWTCSGIRQESTALWAYFLTGASPTLTRAHHHSKVSLDQQFEVNRKVEHMERMAFHSPIEMQVIPTTGHPDAAITAMTGSALAGVAGLHISIEGHHGFLNQATHLRLAVSLES